MDRAQFSYNGYILDIPCMDKGEVIISKRTGKVYPTQNCIAEHQAKCGPDYLPEIIPGKPGCLDTSHPYSANLFYMNIWYRQLIDKPWVSDGITPLEFEIIFWLKEIAKFGARIAGGPAALRLSNMPFMETIEEGDLFILKGLASSRPVYFQRIVSHPSLSDGITDEWANHFSVVGDIVFSDGSEAHRLGLLDTLFDPERTLVEERTITLPLAGDVELAVIRPGARTADTDGSRTMDMLEQAVRSQEEFMGVAFPRDQAILVVADWNPYGPAGRTIIHGTILTEYPENREIIAQGIAHTYWREGSGWLREGASIFMGMIPLGAFDGVPLRDSELLCAPYESIYNQNRDRSVEIVVYAPVIYDSVIFPPGCRQLVGREIFRELYDRLGDGAFRQGFASLYLALQNDSYDDPSHGEACLDADWSACYLRTAFLEGATPDQATIVEDVLARRYYGSS